MSGGTLIDPFEPELLAARLRARNLMRQLNNTPAEEGGTRLRLIRELIPTAGENVLIESPFYCDYGTNITLGDRVFFNYNCVILDDSPVRIGSGVLFGPAVQIYSVSHPLSATQRQRRCLLIEDPVVIGDDVWIGGGSIILAGMEVGSGTVIGAGSVVTSSIPPGVLAAGNPCRVIRELDRDGYAASSVSATIFPSSSLTVR